jgi:hypothetical protein
VIISQELVTRWFGEYRSSFSAGAKFAPEFEARLQRRRNLVVAPNVPVVRDEVRLRPERDAFSSIR